MKMKDWLQQEKEFTLALSAGFFGFYSHAGFLAAFMDSGILPTKITGTSAGAIVAALYGAGHSVNEMKTVLFKLQKSDFWDPSFGLGLLKGEKFECLLSDYLPDHFHELKLPVFISTFDLRRLRTKVYSENASLVKAVRGSCSFPILFHPVKYEGALLIDGGVADDFAIHSVKKDDTVVGHYQLMGVQKNFREKFHLKRLASEKHKFCVIENRIQMGPNRLNQGPLAFDQAYEKAMEYLASPAK